MLNNFSDILKCEKLEDVYEVSQKDINSFTCEQNPHLADFLISYAKNENQLNETKTYLVMTNAEVKEMGIKENEIVAYFSLKAHAFTITRWIEGRRIVESSPTIEISQFAINSSFINKFVKKPKLGGLIFKNFIKPIVNKAANEVGVKYISLYAADNTIKGEQKLIKTYESYGFRIPETDLRDYIEHIATYDKNCQFMYYKL